MVRQFESLDGNRGRVGVKFEEYCSDIQRVAYVLRDGETEAPKEVQRGFDVIRSAIENSRAAMKAQMAVSMAEHSHRDATLDKSDGCPRGGLRTRVSTPQRPPLCVQ